MAVDAEKKSVRSERDIKRDYRADWLGNASVCLFILSVAIYYLLGNRLFLSFIDPFTLFGPLLFLGLVSAIAGLFVRSPNVVALFGLLFNGGAVLLVALVLVAAGGMAH